MTSAPQDRFMTTARVRVPGASTDALNLELFNTIDEFLRRTSGWRYQDTVGVIEGNDTFALGVPAGTALVQVLAAEHNGLPMTPSTSGTGTTVNLTGRIIGAPDPITSDTIFEPDVVQGAGSMFQYAIFFPSFITIDVPADADFSQFPIDLLFALTLSNDNLRLDPDEWPLEDWMWETYHEAWMDGLLSRMMSQIAKPYFNMQMAQYHGRRFRSQMGEAKQTADRGYVRGRRRMVFPRFA